MVLTAGPGKAVTRGESMLSVVKLTSSLESATAVLGSVLSSDDENRSRCLCKLAPVVEGEGSASAPGGRGENSMLGWSVTESSKASSGAVSLAAQIAAAAPAVSITLETTARLVMLASNCNRPIVGRLAFLGASVGREGPLGMVVIGATAAAVTLALALAAPLGPSPSLSKEIGARASGSVKPCVRKEC